MGLDLGVRDLFRDPTVAGLLATAGVGDSGGFEVLLALRSTGDGVPLFCFHPAMGLSWGYSGLVSHVDQRHPIYGLQARALREPNRMPGSIEEVADDYLAEIRSVQPRGPYCLLGWSFGGLVAHTVATRLEAAGQRVAVLALMDSYPVRLPASVQGALAENSANRAVVLQVLLGSAELVERAQQDLPADPSDEEVAAVVSRYNPTLTGVETDRINALFHAARNNLMLVPHFTPGHFSGDLIHLGTRERLARGRRLDWNAGAVETGAVGTCAVCGTMIEPGDRFRVSHLWRAVVHPLCHPGEPVLRHCAQARRVRPWHRPGPERGASSWPRYRARTPARTSNAPHTSRPQ